MKILISAFICLSLFFVAWADFSSSSFILENPVITLEGGESSSVTFRYLSSSGKIMTGQSTSGSFAQNTGFLYFPVATSPSLSATPASSQVNLSWTTSVGTFANVTGYKVGTGTTSGVYTFEDVGNVTNFTKSGLNNGTTYFFKVQAYAGNVAVGESVEVSSIPIGSSTGGGGGPVGGGTTPTGASVIISGRAFPGRTVTLLKDAQIIAMVAADPNANFEMTVSGLSTGDYLFSLFSEDAGGGRSPLYTFPVAITSGVTVKIGGIFIAPSISVDKSEVKRGDNITIFGQTTVNSDVLISVHSEEEFFGRTVSDKNGVYVYNFNTGLIEYGSHHTKSKSSIENRETSGFSKLVGFTVGTKNVFNEKPATDVMKADLNKDKRVNLIDFSIAAYWYKRTLSTEFKPIEIERLNGDGKIDLVDFSIMAFHWTG